MKKTYIAVFTILIVASYGLVTVSFGQTARYNRSARVIEIDFETASMDIVDVQRIYLQNSSTGDSKIFTVQQIQQAAGTARAQASYVVSLPAPLNMPADLSQTPVQLDILVKPDPAKNEISVIAITVEEPSVVVPYNTMLDNLELGLAAADGKDDAELYLSGDVTTAVGSKPNWVAEAKYEREFAFDKFPFIVVPFLNFAYNSKASKTDKLTFGIQFERTFGHAEADSNVDVDRWGQALLTNNPGREETAKFRLLKKARAQREFFQYSGSLQFESDWDFRVNNIVTSQELRYLFRPKFFRNSRRRINGKIMLTPLIGAELGRNLKNPLTSEDRGITRLKAGGILTVTSDDPFGGSFGKELVWENTFTQRWLLLRENAFDKNDDGDLIFKSFGRKPKSHFKSSLEFKFTDYFGPLLSYEWGEEPPLYNKINHKLKIGLVYSFSRKPKP